MSYEFQDATPVKVTGGGRTAAPNPFLKVVASIALKKDSEGNPVAKSFVEKHEAGKRKTHVDRIKGQLSDAGFASDPKVSVPSNAEPVKVPAKGGAKNATVDSETETLITFWTIPRQYRPRKPKAADTATASTEQSTATASA